MTTIPVSAVSNTASTAASSTTTSSNSNDPVAQRNLFMSLLVAQLKNQDPLSPQDGTAFVAQLAQFNSLDQLVGIKQAIEQLTTLLQHPATPPPTTPASSPIAV